MLFAATVQWPLSSHTEWMYSYYVSASELPARLTAAPFFVAVAGAGIAGAYVTVNLVRADKMAAAVLNVAVGVLLWGFVWIATWDRYSHVGSFLAYQQGTAAHLLDSPDLQRIMNVLGVVHVGAGLGLAAWALFSGLKARSAAAVQPDPVPLPWRGVADGPTLAPPAPAPIVVDGKICGVRPGDLAPLPPLPATPVGDVPAMVERAREAQALWARVPLDERLRLVKAAGKRLLQAAAEQVAVIEEENGRPPAESYFFEVLPNADLFAYWTSHARALLQAEPVEIDPIAFPGKRGVIEKVPRGVILVISPWNMPVNLPLRPIVPALLAGNSVVLKPSEFTPRCGALVGKIFGELLPKDVVQVAQGAGDVGAALIEAGVDFVAFTGSPKTGRAVAEAAARHLTPVALELGGKDAAIVLADADLERAANGILWGAFANAGQNCAAVERCYVHRSVAEPFTALLRQKVAALRVGPGKPGEVDVGPLTTPSQKAIVEAQLAQAKERGVVPVVGGAATGVGHHVQPTLVVNPPEELALVQEETFGPVLPVFTYDDEEEAVRRANRSRYGLTASVWSKDVGKAERLARRLQAGVVTVNNHSFTGGLAQAPWGGVRGSGFGVTNSPRAIEELTRPRFVLVDRNRAKKEVWWYPYDASALQVGQGMAAVRSGNLSALGSLVSGFLKRMRS